MVVFDFLLFPFVWVRRTRGDLWRWFLVLGLGLCFGLLELCLTWDILLWRFSLEYRT